tara:strand:+ start:10326 stop:10652 length:327 start_codon:yes stop_codon:yes gene_type:complete
MTNHSDGEIKKLIDPKSGFTLYLRKFSDASISQVSTSESFPIPQDMPNNTAMIDNLDGIKKDIQTMQQQTRKTMESMQETILKLNKRNATLLRLMAVLFIVILTSVFL